MKNFIFLFLFICSINATGQSSLIGNIQSSTSDSVDYKSVKLYTESYAYVSYKYKPQVFETFLFVTNASDEAVQVFRKLFKKAGFKSFYYDDLFEHGVKYSQSQIDEILKTNKIDGIVKIGVNRDVYNAGARFYSTNTSTGNFGSSKNTYGAEVTLYVDFYNEMFQKFPFIRTEGIARSGVLTNRDVVLCNKLFWIALDKLLEKKNIITQ